MKEALVLVLALALFLLPIGYAVYAETAVYPVQAPAEEVVVPEPAVEEVTPEPAETDPGGALPIDLTELFQAVWSVLALVVVRYVIPWIRSKIKAERLAAFDYWSTVAVTAAEKAYGAGKGNEKLAMAADIMRSHGFTIDTDVVDALIKQLFEGDRTYEYLEEVKPKD